MPASRVQNLRNNPYGVMQMMHDAASKRHWRRSTAPHTVRDHASSTEYSAPQADHDARAALAWRAVGITLATLLLATPAGAGQAQGRRRVGHAGRPTPNRMVSIRIRSTGKIVLAHREGAVPFSILLDANKKPVGYGAGPVQGSQPRTVRKHLGLKTLDIAYLAVNNPKTRIDAIVTGKADLECGATTNNAERRQKVAFTIPHYITGTRFAVRADSPIEELTQFEGHTLVSTAGSTPFKAVATPTRTACCTSTSSRSRTTPRR